MDASLCTQGHCSHGGKDMLMHLKYNKWFVSLYNKVILTETLLEIVIMKEILKSGIQLK